MNTYEHSAEDMARKLLEFNRDFSDFDEDIQAECESLTAIIEELRESDKYNSLMQHLDIMFMDDAFN
jgi:hypothetical protein